MQLVMERAFSSAGIDWRYLTLDVSPDRLASALRGMQSLGFHGAHLNGPHRFQALEFVDIAEDSARRAGWIDCISVTSEGLKGHNRWGESIRDLIGNPQSEEDAILFYGNDPGIPAIAAKLLEAGWKPVHFSGISKTAISEHRAKLDLHVPVGPKPWSPTTRAVIVSEDADTADLIDKNRFSRLAAGTVVIDLSQSGSFSPVTRAAESAGMKAISGLDVLVRYTADTFFAWTGIQPDEQILRESFEEYYEI
jgi:shikimate dehydrogenase